MKPMAFAKISPVAARLQTAMFARTHGLSVDCGGSSWRVVAGGGMRQAGLAAYCRLGVAEIVVWLEEEGWRTAAATVLECPPPEVDRFPEMLVRAALECFFADVMAGVEKGVGEAMTLDRLEMRPTGVPASANRVALRRDGGPRLEAAWVAGGVDDGWYNAMEKRLRALPARVRELPGDVPVSGAVCLGAWFAPAADVEGLATGDVVLLPGVPARFLTVGGAVRFAASGENGILAVEGKSMTQTTPEAERDGEKDPVSLDGVEVELQARVGTLTVTLAQLRQLGEGQVVEFSTPVDSPVTLTVSGRPVASGELVDVGGRVGVRITGMAEA